MKAGNLKSLMVLLLPFVVIGGGFAVNHTNFNTKTDSVQDSDRFHQQKMPNSVFKLSGNCMSCHNGMMSSSGMDVSIGSDWRASMMANSGRDPYWHASVRRETMDHPKAKAEIEDECSTCHMPMAHTQSNFQGQHGKVFSHLPSNKTLTKKDKLALDGVSCTTCHQITSKNFGKRKSFVGQFGIDSTTSMGNRNIYGPYRIDSGRTRLMHSSSGFRQKQSKHIQKSELCATCHTLYTKALGPNGKVIGELPEQVPYLEWRHSTFKDEQSCQSCHMPELKKPTPIASTTSRPRPNFSKHTFRGGNFFMLSILNKYRAGLGVKALPQEMNEAILRTKDFLREQTARLKIKQHKIHNDTLIADISITNLAGHKLPTAYPSRRVWLHVTVTDDRGRVIFESGEVRPNGSIIGNDNDRSADRYEPHYRVITDQEQVQIYEAIMVGQDNQVTTGLLSAVRFVKDNRLLPKGFNKKTAGEDIAVQGQAYTDGNFSGGGDRVTYRIPVETMKDNYHIKAELRYQPVAYRWAQNLDSYNSRETNRFVGYYQSMSNVSSTRLARAQAVVLP